MQRLWVLWTAFVVGFSGAIMPGPMLVATINESLQWGFWVGPAVVFGHALVEMLLVVGLAYGAGKFLTSKKAFVAIGLLGGVMLILMGADMIMHRELALHFAQPPERHPLSCDVGPHLHAIKHFPARQIFAGIITTIGNPYFFLWWATIGLALIQDAQKRKVGAATFFTGHILSDVVWFSLVSLAIAHGRDILPTGAFVALFWICGIALIGLGAWFIFSGIKRARAT